MARIKLHLAYVGTAFAGWQLQALNQGKTPRTVQGELEKSLFKLLREPIRVHHAGRTDAGVHADEQVVHFDIADTPKINWLYALNNLLPLDIRILKAEEVSETFHARFDSIARIYHYALWQSSEVCPPRLSAFTLATPTLNLERMQVAAKLLCGTHDFAAFQNSGSEPSDTLRTLYDISYCFLPYPGEAVVRSSSAHLQWGFYGNGFLKQMVRNLMGFLLWVGLEKIESRAVPALLESKSRNFINFPTAPACGLSMHRVLYAGSASA